MSAAAVGLSRNSRMVGAVIRKELTEFRRNRLIVSTTAILPLIFLISPTASILTLKPSALSPGLDKRVDAALFLPVLHAPQLAAELVFIPLLAAWAIWVGLAISARTSDTRVAQQLSILASLPPVALTALMSFRLISPTFGLAAALAGGLLAIDCVACIIVARLFDRERLITGAEPSRRRTSTVARVPGTPGAS